MPKNKKTKTTHHSSKNPGDLSQAEIWDDSALIRSWNDAVAEYEYYHSIHARGEDVEEIIRQAETDELGQARAESEAIAGVQGEWHDTNADVDGEDEDFEDGDLEDGEVDDENELNAARRALNQEVVKVTTIQPDPIPETNNANPQTTNHELPKASPPKNPSIGPNLPPTNAEAECTAPAPASLDQTLENVKMAYYWAGYYSGLYDGQRQAVGTNPTKPRPERSGL
ncbi:uncharacterized protein Z518_11028 [Rhinocladiella mackenziei CBS 650.93]|uniref:Survival Motor Neuron Gemin2-binding domain-containing protein n=1 Tax=Rhinocladiella mackenziei CBS 650.93 TaxID=1442369 RepID=A0A0D2I8Q9_9EURO|nr:uncharacterized protein Z518_11028 [Rhinocladiella mackenziei CBS 650.93]KIW99615.1 hypothetical protein Z518_11028 [Rhinocladiella mackenziei CBS 650.93]